MDPTTVNQGTGWFSRPTISGINTDLEAGLSAEASSKIPAVQQLRRRGQVRHRRLPGSGQG